MSTSVILFLAIVLGAPTPLAISAGFMWDAFSQPSRGQAQVPAASLSMRFEVEGEAMTLEDTVVISEGVDANGLPAFYGQLSVKDAEEFADFTHRHVQEKVRFIVCDTTIFEPFVRTKISGGRVVIAGQDANRMLSDFMEYGCP